MRLNIEECVVIGIAQSHDILLLIAQDGDGYAVYVVAFVSAQVGVGIGGLHHVDALHQSCPLVSRIAVDDNFLDCRAELDVTALFQPGGNASVVEIAHGQLLVFQQQGYQFMDVVCHEVPLGVNDETAVLQQRRRDVHLDVLAQEPAFHLVIPPSAGRIDGGEALYDHFYAFGQVVDARQTTLVLLAHHDTLVLTQRILTQPECHQGKTQRIEVYGSRYLHLAVDDVVIHLRSGIERGAGLCRAVQLFVVLHHAGDAEIAQHQFLVFLVAEEEVAGLDVLMNDIIVMAIGQGGSTLEGYTTELIDVAVQVIVGERSALQILHQLIVAVLAVHIGLAKVGHLDDHLEVEVLDNAQQRLLDVEVGIVNLQHPLPFLAFHQEHLRLAGIVAQALDGPIRSAFQGEVGSLLVASLLCCRARTQGLVTICSCWLWTADAYGCGHVGTLWGRLPRLCICQVHGLFIVFNFFSTVLSQNHPFATQMGLGTSARTAVHGVLPVAHPGQSDALWLGGHGIVACLDGRCHLRNGQLLKDRREHLHLDSL